jgi:phage terminase Nu1 subunit (DNA packaging protein)
MRGVLRRVASRFAGSILEGYPLRTERTVTEVLKSLASYDLDALRAEVARARARQDFSEGLYGHCISLPAAHDLAPEYRSHHNNLGASSTR